MKILFVCLGNICRSPTAEGVFQAMLTPEDDIAVDSAGTGAWHIGNPPDARAIAEAARRGNDISGLRARQVCEADFEDFDLILAMDRSNLRDLNQMQPIGSRAVVKLFLSYGQASESTDEDVPDPYYDDGFERAYGLIEAASWGLLTALRDRNA